MTTIWRHRLRRARFLLTGALAAAVIGVAVMVALAQLLLPLAARYPARVAALLSEQVGQPVHFAALRGHWQASGPLLTLSQVSIGRRGRAPALQLPSAEVKLDLGALLWPSRHLVNLRLRGLQLDLQRHADGRWQVAGFGRAGTGGQQQVSLDDLPGNVWLEDLHLNLAFSAKHPVVALVAPAVRVSNGNGVVHFAATISRPGATSRFNLVGKVAADGSRGRLFLQAVDVDLKRLLGGFSFDDVQVRGGAGSAGMWLGWRQGRIDELVLRTDLRRLQVAIGGGMVQVPAWKATLSMLRGADGTEVLYDQGEHGALRARISGAGEQMRIDASARDLDLRTPAALAALLPGLPVRWSHWLAAAHIHGRLATGALHWSREHGLQWASARLDGVGLDAVGAVPGIDTLSGVIDGDAEALAMQLPQQATTLRMPHVFRQPFVLSQLRGSVAAWHAADGWHVGTGGLAFDGDGYGGEARGQVLLPADGGRPFLNLYAGLDHGRMNAAKLFWPVHDMSPHAVAWLDRSLVSGDISYGACVLRGSLADWPFVNHHGRFEASAHVRQGVLDYSPKWPRAEGITADAYFIDDRMVIEGTAAQTLGNTASHVVATIPSYRLDELILVVQGTGHGNGMLDFVRQSPVGESYADAIRHLGLNGDGAIDFSLILPFKDVDKMQLTGSVDFDRATVTNPDWNLQLKQLSGRLRFGPKGLSGEGLGARFRGVPVTLGLKLGAATGQPNVPVQVSARGHFDVPTLIQGYPTLAPLGDIAHGTSDFSVSVDVEHDAAGKTSTRLRVDSDLTGITLDLPAPLDKADPTTTLPMHLMLGLPTAAAPLQLSLGDVARARGRLPGDHGEPLALAVRMGGQWPDSLPAKGIRIDGETKFADLSGWAQRGLAAAGDGQGRLDGVDLRVAHARIFDKVFDKLHVTVQPSADATKLTFDGPQAKGTLTVPTGDVGHRGVVARFQRLFWPGDEPDNTVPAAAASTAQASSGQTAMAMAGVDPGQLPPLHVWVGDLRLGAAHLGEARFESWPTAKGMHIDQLRTHSPDVQLSASGDWNGSAHSNQTHLVIDFGAENLGHMLSALGFSGLFDGGRTQAHLDASWPGAPSAVTLANMQGTLKVDVGKGRIPEVQPGVGRLFGLMSIAELPRRFSLDFGDVFGKGFGFDSIKGNFRFADGNAYTSDLHVKGPAADVYVTGRTGLRAKDYDQRVRVIPHVGSSLPVVGAIAGGPIGAAAGFAVQSLLGHGLNRVASARYSVTGPWDKPVIKLVEKKTVKIAAPKPSPPASSSATAPASPTSTAPAATTSVAPASAKSGG